ncbi:Histone deacetylase complex subunit, partial [Dispira simplex]
MAISSSSTPEMASQSSHKRLRMDGPALGGSCRSSRAPKVMEPSGTIPDTIYSRPKPPTSNTGVFQLPISHTRRIVFPKPRRPLKPLDFKQALKAKSKTSTLLVIPSKPSSICEVLSSCIAHASFKPLVQSRGRVSTIRDPLDNLVTYQSRLWNARGPLCVTIGNATGLWRNRTAKALPQTTSQYSNLPFSSKCWSGTHWRCPQCSRLFPVRGALEDHLIQCVPASQSNSHTRVDRDAGISFCLCMQAPQGSDSPVMEATTPMPVTRTGPRTTRSRRVRRKSTKVLSNETSGGASSTSADEAPSMIQCDQCYVWLHMNCVHVEESTVPEVYVCPRCKSEATVNQVQTNHRHGGLRPPSQPGRRKSPLSPNSVHLERLLADVPDLDASQLKPVPSTRHSTHPRRTSTPLHARKPPRGPMAKALSNPRKLTPRGTVNNRRRNRGLPSDPHPLSEPPTGGYMEIPPANMFAALPTSFPTQDKPTTLVSTVDGAVSSDVLSVNPTFPMGMSNHLSQCFSQSLTVASPGDALSFTSHVGNDLGAIHPTLLYSEDPIITEALNSASRNNDTIPFSTQPVGPAITAGLDISPTDHFGIHPYSMPLGAELWDMTPNAILSSTFVDATDPLEMPFSGLHHFDASEADFLLENLLSEADLDPLPQSNVPPEGGMEIGKLSKDTPGNSVVSTAGTGAPTSQHQNSSSEGTIYPNTISLIPMNSGANGAGSILPCTTTTTLVSTTGIQDSHAKPTQPAATSNKPRRMRAKTGQRNTAKYTANRRRPSEPASMVYSQNSQLLPLPAFSADHLMAAHPGMLGGHPTSFMSSSPGNYSMMDFHSDPIMPTHSYS